MTGIFGEYVPGLVSAAVAYTFTSGQNLFGTGVPTANPGVPFAVYTDSVTGNEYFWNGSTWTAIAGGSGGSLLVGNYAGTTPNVTPSGPTMAEDGSTGELWWYTGVKWVDTGITLPL
jgi:hypothetical protein